METGTPTYQQTRSLLLEHLKAAPQGQYTTAWDSVLYLAWKKGFLPGVSAPPSATSVTSFVVGERREIVAEDVRQLLWSFLVQGIVVFGLDGNNPNWPFYRLTPHGKKVVDGQKPQPYDPDGFLAEFKRAVPSADPVVFEYLDEALRTFNHGCPRAAAVMLGAASEKLVLVLHEAFGTAIADPTKKAKFEKDSAKSWAISNKYAVLRDRLDLMVDGKKLKGEHADTVSGSLGGGFDLIRRTRNTAGHPEAPGDVDLDTLFLHLRIFTEYARRMAALIDHFRANQVDW